MQGLPEWAKIAIRKDIKKIFYKHAEDLLQYVKKERSYIM